MFHVTVNEGEVHSIASADEAERLCARLAELPAFAAQCSGPAGGRGPTLDVFVNAGWGVVSFLDMNRGVKLVSRNPGCSDREPVLLAERHWELHLPEIEVERRGLISANWAIAILQCFLTTGEPVHLFPWPDDSEDTDGMGTGLVCVEPEG